VARGFGPPSRTLQLAVRLVRPGGVVVISEPPDGDRWSDDPLVQTSAVVPDFGTGGVVRFQVER